MNHRFTRRAAITAGLGAPVLLLGGGEEAAAQGPVEARSATCTGPFQVDHRGVLIGLLLPAVRRVRRPFRLRLLDSAGVAKLDIPIDSSEGRTAAFFEVSRSEVVGTGESSGVPILVVSRETGEQWNVPTADGILIGLLLPAVQRTGLPAVQLAASVFQGGLLPENAVSQLGQRGFLLPFIEQDNLLLSAAGSARRHHFVGPFQLSSEESGAEIGLLLPAVQRVREAARMVFLDSAGNILSSTALPAVRSPFYDATFAAVWGDGSVRIFQKVRGGEDVLVGEGAPDGVLIGLLLPAVQLNGVSAGLVGGTLRLDGQYYQLQPMSTTAGGLS